MNYLYIFIKNLGVSDLITVLQVIGIMNRGGAETMIMNLYRNIDRTKVQFDFVVHTNENGVFDDEIKSYGGNIYHCPKYNGKNHFEYKKWWNKFFLEHSKKYSIVHGHIGSTTSIYLSVAKKYGLFTIAHSHNTDGNLNLKNFLYKLMSISTRYIADYFFACSLAAGKDRYGKNIVNNLDKFHILNNAIDTERFMFDLDLRAKVRNEFNISSDKIVIGHIGRFQPQKNHSFLIDIFKCIVEKNNNSVLLLCGVGELKNEIYQKVKTLGIENNVIFLGLRPDIERVCQAFDIFLFPSLYEGLPVTLVEIQAAGVPCVISDVITKEVCITNIVKMISLNEDPEIWADEVLRYSDSIKSDTSEQIKSAGFDIKETALWLQNFYLNKTK